jgi:hypothetical protein
MVTTSYNTQLNMNQSIPKLESKSGGNIATENKSTESLKPLSLSNKGNYSKLGGKPQAMSPLGSNIDIKL